MQVVATTDSRSRAENACNGGLLLAGEPLALLGGTRATGGALLMNAPAHTLDTVVCEDLVLIDEEDVTGHSCLRVLESLGALDDGGSALASSLLKTLLDHILQGVESGLLGGLPSLTAIALHASLSKLAILLLEPNAIIDPPQLIIGHTIYFGLLGRAPLLGILDAGLTNAPLHSFNAEVHKL